MSVNAFSLGNLADATFTQPYEHRLAARAWSSASTARTAARAV